MTKRSPITYGRLGQLLLFAGFTSEPTEGPYKIFRYSNTKNVVVLPGFLTDQIVRPVHIAAVRRTLKNVGSKIEYELISD
jgi:hypothetical protein